MSMFSNLKNLAGMLGQARELREKLAQVQAELARKTVEADSGAGAVRVVMNGRFEVVSVRIDRPLMTTLAGAGESTSDADQQMVEELLAAAFNAALLKAQDMVREEMSRITGGLQLPPGMEKMLDQNP